MKALITGGAGFIGSRLAEKLLEQNHEVVIVDNLSSGSRSFVPDSARFIQADLKTERLESLFKEVDTVFHFAANPYVNTFPEDRDRDFKDNLQGTKNVVDAVADADVGELVFASSSVVYGEDAEIPTPETADMDPISMYGATKCGGEHICQVYSDTFGFDLTVLRYANIVGGRNRKGVVYDFVNKIHEEPEKLKILGNGRQRKSYLYIEDAVDASLKAWKSAGNVFNIGSEDSVSVDRIADIVSDTMDENPDYEYTGGKKGWEGDVPEMRLSIEKIKNQGWRPSLNSEESIRKTAEELVDQL